jgi:O-Antigen ligase
MSTDAIVLLAGLLSWWVASQRSVAAAFLLVYLPVLLVLPDYYTLAMSGLPELSFNQSAILPIGAIVLWRAVVKRQWTVSPVDYAIAAFLGWQVISEIYNLGTPDRRLCFDLLTLAVFPYMAGKTLIEPQGLRGPFARRLVWSIFLVSLISVWEFKMGVSLFRPVIGVFFPGGMNATWVTQVRWGFGRTAGPYGHAITMGVFVGVGYVIHRWLCLAGLWEPTFKWAKDLPFSKSQVLTGGLLAGLFMTLSRGPWLGVAAGAVLASVGARDNHRRALKRAVVALSVSGVILYTAGSMYLSGVSAFEGVEEQASAQYRAILIGAYEDIVMQRPVMGWGRANWPQLQEMKSIDNNYLFVALGSGLIGLGLFLIMLVISVWRIFASGYLNSALSREERMFRFTLFGAILVIALSTTTTYIGSVMYPLTFLLFGWSEGCLLTSAEEFVESPERWPAEEGFRLMRVVA